MCCILLIINVVDHMKWFRDHAACDCAVEEKEILESEFDHMLHSFSRMAEVWKALAERNALAGYHSYVSWQALMYDTFYYQCWDLYLKAHALHQKYCDKNLDMSCLSQIVGMYFSLICHFTNRLFTSRLKVEDAYQNNQI